MKKINSLYWLIEQTSRQKNRPLKIIVDWDDTIQAHQSQVLYELCEEWKTGSTSFEFFFNNWSVKIDKIKEKSDFYNRAPFLTIADELLLAIEKNLIEELIFLSYFNKQRFPEGDIRKEKKFQKTFGKLSHQVKISMKLISSSKTEWIIDNYSNFDMFVDDLPKTISESVETFSNDKIFVIPNQELNCGINSPPVDYGNVYHLLTGVSLLKEKDFEEIAVQNTNICESESRIMFKYN